MSSAAADGKGLFGAETVPVRAPSDWEHASDQRLVDTLRRETLATAKGDSTAAGPLDSGQSTPGSQRFRIVRSHAEGGLGKVSVATDEELNREVALKEIKPQFAHHAESQARFMLEAEITGGLEHPGIVPVYGLGRHADGRPYYAMRFIQGDSLHDALTGYHSREPAGGEAAVEFRKLLGRFIDVCQAIDYAHSRGVLHRDLKPGNIMLGKYGETLVVDWGLAKAAGKAEHCNSPAEGTLSPTSGSAVEPTQMGTALGTPAFMSPEQAAGRLDELGPATDVYSLGATLYQVLTGQAAFASQPLRETLEQVECGDFPHPRAMNPRVPLALEAICLKAMSLRPADRYASAGELAEELERWLADEPVRAWREPLRVRTRRWLKQHQALVTGSIAAALVGLVSLSALLLVVGDRNRQLAGKNSELGILIRELDDKNDKLVAAIGRAEDNERAAKANEQFAREQSQFALHTLDTVAFELQRDLQNVAGTQAARRRVLATALARLEQLSGQYLKQAAIDRTSLAALVEMAGVILRIGTDAEIGGDTIAAKIGGAPPSTERQTALGVAHRIYRRAHEMARELAAAHPNDGEAQRDLAISYINLGDVSLKLGKSGDSLAYYQKLREISENLATSEPSSIQAQRDLAVSYCRLGDVTWRLGQTSQSLAFYRQGLNINEKVAAAEPGSAAAQRDVAASYERLGVLALQVGDTRDAQAHYQRMFETCRRLAAAEPGDALAQRDLALAHGKLGDVARRLGQTREALAQYEQMLEICAKQAVAEPSDLQAQSDVARAHSKLGDVEKQLGQAAIALAHFQMALAIREQRATEDPADAPAQRDLASSQRDLGDELLLLDRTDEALAHYQKSLEINEKCATADPTDADARRDMAISQDKLGQYAARLGNLNEALVHYQQALAIHEHRAVADPHDKEAQRDISLSHNNMGDVTQRLGQNHEALAHYRKSLAIDEKRTAADPSDAQAQRDLAISYANVADTELRLGHTNEAHRHYRRSLAILEKRAAAEPGDVQTQRLLLAGHHRLGLVAVSEYKFQVARDHYQSALSMFEPLAARTALPALERQAEQLKQRIEHCGKCERAMVEIDFALSRDEADRTNLLDTRVRAMLAYAVYASDDIPATVREKWPAKERPAALFREALLTADRFRATESATPESRYDACCCYALCLAGLAKLNVPGKERLQVELQAKALAELKAALAAGYKDAEHMRQDADLESLRKLSEFNALLESITPS